VKTRFQRLLDTDIETTGAMKKKSCLGYVGDNWVVVSNIVFFHPENWGRFPFWLIFFTWVETTN